jgi:hypothetical protein
MPYNVPGRPDATQMARPYSHIDPVVESASLAVERHDSGACYAHLYIWEDGVRRSAVYALTEPKPFYRTMSWSVGALTTALAGLIGSEEPEARALKSANRQTSDTSQKEGA